MLWTNSVCDEIEPGLFLGSLAAAKNSSFLENHHVTHVVTAFSHPVVKSERIKTMFVDVEDSEFCHHYGQTIAVSRNKKCAALFSLPVQHLEATVTESLNKISSSFAGRSRSAAIVIAYLMKKYGISVNDAKNRVKEKRDFISPNAGFEKQLKMYEDMGCVLDKEYVKCRPLQLRHSTKQANGE